MKRMAAAKATIFFEFLAVGMFAFVFSGCVISTITLCTGQCYYIPHFPSILSRIIRAEFPATPYPVEMLKFASSQSRVSALEFFQRHLF
jgi:hypothetical protein